MRVSTSRRKADALGEIRPLVEHHAFGALRHRRVGHFGAARHAVAHEIVEHLRRPNHRRVRRLAEPQDFLLHFAEPGEAEFDREVAARDHYRGRIVRRRLQDEGRKIAHRERRLDLQHEPRRLALGRARHQMILQELDVVDPLHERIADQIGMLGDEVEIAEVLGGQRRQIEFGRGKIDALAGFQPHALLARGVDLDLGPARPLR